MQTVEKTLIQSTYRQRGALSKEFTLPIILGEAKEVRCEAGVIAGG